MPFILVAVVFLTLIAGPSLSLEIKQILYALSLALKTVIISVLPFIIFGLLFKTCVTLSHRATGLIGGILGLVCVSNFLSTFLSHYAGEWVYHFDLSLISPEKTQMLFPAWTFELPTLVANDRAMFAGLLLGVMASYLCPQPALRGALILENLIHRLLRGIVYTIPLFVAGFMLKLQYEGVIQVLLREYALILTTIALAQLSYIFVAYLSLDRFKLLSCLTSLKNMIPAALSGFSTMSSAASMPLTIMGAENNSRHKDLAAAVVPATVNIHLIGDCIAIPIFAYAVLKSYGMALPSLEAYLLFTVYFVMAKFSVAAVPGGGILVMLPILKQYLGFNAEMMSLITALYILFDPIITCINVLGNGAFVKLIDVLDRRRPALEAV